MMSSMKHDARVAHNEALSSGTDTENEAANVLRLFRHKKEESQRIFVLASSVPDMINKKFILQ